MVNNKNYVFFASLISIVAYALAPSITDISSPKSDLFSWAFRLISFVHASIAMISYREYLDITEEHHA